MGVLRTFEQSCKSAADASLFTDLNMFETIILLLKDS